MLGSKKQDGGDGIQEVERQPCPLKASQKAVNLAGTSWLKRCHHNNYLNDIIFQRNKQQETMTAPRTAITTCFSHPLSIYYLNTLDGSAFLDVHLFPKSGAVL